MNRKEYLERLEQLLLVLSMEEREEALQYYTDYFDDAGVENEDKVIMELGTPEEVAAKIRSGFVGEYGEYSEQGFEDPRFQHNQEIVADSGVVEHNWEEISGEESGIQRRGRNQNTNAWKVIAIILLILFAAPVLLPVGIAAIVIILALLITVAAILFGVGVSGFAILFAGVATIAAGLAKVFITPAAGIMAAGVGCILVAIGILLSWVIVSILVKVVPGMIRGIVHILGTPFRKAGVK